MSNQSVMIKENFLTKIAVAGLSTGRQVAPGKLANGINLEFCRAESTLGETPAVFRGKRKEKTEAPILTFRMSNPRWRGVEGTRGHSGTGPIPDLMQTADASRWAILGAWRPCGAPAFLPLRSLDAGAKRGPRFVRSAALKPRRYCPQMCLSLRW